MKTYQIIYTGINSRFQDLDETVRANSEREAVEKFYSHKCDENYFPQEDGSIHDADGDCIAAYDDNAIMFDGGHFEANEIKNEPNLIVVAIDPEKYGITYANNFEYKDASELYDKDGNRMDFSEEGWTVKAWTYTTGSQFASFVLDDLEFGAQCVESVSPKFEAEILAAFAGAKFSEFLPGYTGAEFDGWQFVKSQFSSNPWLATVEKA